MAYAPGDLVHLAGLGTGTVRESRGRGRYAVEIKGRLVIAAEADLSPADVRRKSQRRRAAPGAPAAPAAPSAPAAPGAPGTPAPETLDLHGKSVDEAVIAVESFINAALLAGRSEVRVIHGRGGGRVRQAVHELLRTLPIVAAFRVDPRNPGVTLVSFA